MGLLLFIRWWYGPGWSGSFGAIFERVQLLSQELSMGILVRTIFEPWKQITLYSGPGASFDAKIHVFLDNIFSRVFGFVIRSAVLFIGILLVGIVFLLGTLLAFAWPIIPALPIIFIALAVM
jgi:hypothetical protein